MANSASVYFSDFFGVSVKKVEDHGALNISLVNDLPLFVDPFLLFGSESKIYQELHKSIINYIIFLRDKVKEGKLTKGLIKSWFTFPEEKGNWLGYSETGNRGHGLGDKFAVALSTNLASVFKQFGNETILESSHLEKLGLIKSGVGRDNISDLTTNLIKQFLLEYTQDFAVKNIDDSLLADFAVRKVYFDYDREIWMGKTYRLPHHKGEYVILTPKDILTKDDIWINRGDLEDKFRNIIAAHPDENLRDQLNNYLANEIRARDTKTRNEEKRRAIDSLIETHPELLDYYLKMKEEDKDSAISLSEAQVDEIDKIFIENAGAIRDYLSSKTEFYSNNDNSLEESLKRAIYLKDFIEKYDGWTLFYYEGKPITSEKNLQLIYKLTWFASRLDVNREVNNGRGPVDYAISNGASNKALVEFKLASNSKLEQNLKNQVGIYEAANNTQKSIKVIMYFKDSEQQKLLRILKSLKIENDPNIIVIDATPKQSASNVK